MKRKWIRPLAALTALGIVLTLPLNSRAVTALDEERSCSLTIDFVNEKSDAADSYAKAWELDLENLTGNAEKDIECNLVVDVYRIGEAVKIPGYDSYTIILAEGIDKYLEGKIGTESGILKEVDGRLGVDGDASVLTSGTVAIDQEALENAKASVWQGLAQAAAEYVLGENPVKPTDTVSVGDTASDLEQGLYLLIPRGDGRGQTAYYGEEKYSEYKVAGEGGESFRYANAIDAAGEDEDSRLVTYAYTEKYAYTFEPQLVSLPNKTGNGSIDGGAGVSGTEVNTADQVAWEYDLQVYLKPSRELRYGNLKIVKNLELYETLDPSVWAPDENEEPGEGIPDEDTGIPEDENGEEIGETADAVTGIPTEEKATFAFQIRAVWQNAEGNWITVYDDVKSLTFNGHGTDEILIEHIPAGSRVTVTEVYTGASYEFVSAVYEDADGNPDYFTIFAEDWLAKRESSDVKQDDWITATFTNRYNETRTNGYGVTNHFEQDENGGWQWRKLEDNSTLAGDNTVEGN